MVQPFFRLMALLKLLRPIGANSGSLLKAEHSEEHGEEQSCETLFKTIRSVKTNATPRPIIDSDHLSGHNALNGLYFVCVESKILTRHREELHLTTSLIRNHAPCNSVAIYLC